MARTRAWLRRAAVPVAAVTALTLSGGWLTVRDDAGGWPGGDLSSYGGGAGMMGGAGMGLGLAGNDRPVSSLGGARARAELFADRLDPDLRVGEVMRFTNHYYADIESSAGTGLTEVLVDSATGAVGVEPGPAMMWNTRYGMAPGVYAGGKLDAAEARTRATRWLREVGRSVDLGPAEAFPGYYTMHTLKSGRVDGMLSVHATTGVVWYHGWHGRFLELAERTE